MRVRLPSLVRMKMKNNIVLVVGDWSHDGHERTDQISIVSNLNAKQIEEAYKLGTQIMNFDFQKTVCTDYEDNFLDEEDSAILKSFGINQHDEECQGCYLNSEIFAEIWMQIAKLGNPLLEYKFVSSKANTINIGGYGLF